MVLRYFGIRVTDLERSVKFYTELLGLKEVRHGTMRHGGK
jgi:catechol 2,3-dioxygenase-like lactoylglutathione lyase family enzyme